MYKRKIEGVLLNWEKDKNHKPFINVYDSYY